MEDENIASEQSERREANGNADSLLAASINEKLSSLTSLPSQCCIYRVPDTLRRVNEEAFVPRILSIGPVHHGKKRLRDMEGHKWQYLKALLQRKPGTMVERYVKAMRELEARTRGCYAEIIKFDSDEFVTMMLLDGCFIIELFLKNKNKQLRDEDDPIFNRTMVLTDLHRDLILLENQLPFFVLETLFNLIENTDQEGPSTSVLELTYVFFKFLGLQEVLIRDSQPDVKHLLDLLRLWFVPPSSTKSTSKSKFELIRSVTELHEAGVKFRMGTVSCLMEIKFINGVLEIPPLTIEDTTDSLLGNLIAFEQCCNRFTPHYITDYVILMEYLINSPKDVALLSRYGIINNLLGDNEGVSHLFKKLGKEVVFNSDKFQFSNLCRDVNKYHKTRWHIWRATLRRDYFNNPWAIISFIGAVLLLFFTLIQTVCSLLSLKKGNNK
ncbi:UPF0481 protein [Vitis vinifera]|uniref:UPF0481 protein n=2 Tax=Vitis vinifera TaxID=29760 RepID=A0A438HB15_VITVI|nr:UPF0481 protein [Vitis vinifera]CAN68458.1 hypothetical protein VITISV_031449 [Vitis vinifera]